MKKIGLLSDTHGYVSARALSFLSDCDEIWHAGDIGDIATANQLSALKPFRAVYGNIDGGIVRTTYPLFQQFICEEVSVLMIHIGGYPGRYTREASELIKKFHPRLFISGHSHILKVVNDPKNNLLHINPGAAGKYGIHTVATLVRFVIDKARIYDLEILEHPK
ncbi:MAG: metallophosphoesterase family protein [Bacteroidales bacterium]|jgi:putative phosphoesterase|nr:metallophosphatase family protein [Bacteroidales bacterium]MDD3702272.1 metallophosphoesterase family protein [Bacteroidales bacterium]MDY0368853.1 metallophosphoesterase family protein [Bacteroidales bacterium]